MTQRLAIDYSFARPSPTAIKAAGYEGVLRYLSFTSGKNLSAIEAKALHAAGLWIGLVWETTANRASQGAQAGAADVKAAEAQADALGYPPGAVLFYAVDFDASPSQVSAYFKAINAGNKRPVGVYGSRRVVEAGLAPYHWQTVAWSGGVVSTSAHLYQRLTKTHTIAGAPSGWDENVVIQNIPAWPATPVVPPIPPNPHPTPPPTGGIDAAMYFDVYNPDINGTKISSWIYVGKWVKVGGAPNWGIADNPVNMKISLTVARSLGIPV